MTAATRAEETAMALSRHMMAQQTSTGHAAPAKLILASLILDAAMQCSRHLW
jgi:hypothetical protein